MADDGRGRRDPVAPEMEPTVEIEQAGTRLLGDRRRMLSVLAAFVLLIAGIYILLPKITGVSGSFKKLSDPNWIWVGVAVAFKALSFVAYAALFKGVLGGRDERSVVHRRLGLGTSLNITLAGLTATTLFSAAGAGGVALTYWALRKAGMERRNAASRMVAFLVLMYAVYAAALIVFGVLLRIHVLSGDAPLGGTIVPAGIAAALFVVVYLIALIPRDLERRIARHARHGFVRRLASVPATIGSGTRTALVYVRHPGSGSTALLGAVGYWAAMVGILWASFHAFGGGVPLGVVVQGFFVGMAANLAPSPAAGAGTLDAGLIGAFLLFNIPSATVFPAVLAFRLVGFWLPILPGLVSYFALRRQVSHWQEDDRRNAYTSESKVTAEAK